MLEAKYQTLEQRKMIEIMELQGEVNDLMKHLEVQSAVSNADKGIKEVRTSLGFFSVKLVWSVVYQVAVS